MSERKGSEKKVIVVAGIEDRLRQEYLGQMKAFLGDLVEVQEYAVGREQGLIRGDEAIALTHAAGAVVRQFAGNIPVTLLRTTFTQKALERLRQIPEGTSVALISYEWTFLAECIELLRRLGIHHLHFIPYYKGMEEGAPMPNVKIGVYMGYVYARPPFVEELIDIGWRKITPDSYMEIMSCVGIDGKTAAERLSNLREELPQESADIGMIMSDFSAVSRLQRVLDAVPMGVLIVDGQGCVEVYNSFIGRAFGISMTEMIGRNTGEHAGLASLYKNIEGTKLEQNLYYTDSTLQKEYIVRRKNVCFMEKKYQDIILMEEAVEERKKSKGHPVRKLPGACYTFQQIIGNSEVMRYAVDYAEKYAQTDLSVLILGETGTGKELFAHAIHNASARSSQPFISLNCAAIPAELLESELFGYERGSFTGARDEGKKGLFELANGGTIFLDEIGDAGEMFQVKLLRVLQERELTKVGGYEKIPLDIRIVAATNKPLNDLENCLGFRRDLFYRLSSCILSIPPLRQRRGDILLLTRYYLDSMGATEKEPNGELQHFLEGYSWDGNVRELKNCVEYMGYFGDRELTPEALPMMYRVAYEKGGEKQGKEQPTLQAADLSKKETDVEVLLLELIAEKSRGRRQLTAELRRRGISCTEYDVRNAMDILAQKGWLEKGIGRGGSFLTAEGAEQLSQNGK